MTRTSEHLSRSKSDHRALLDLGDQVAKPAVDETIARRRTRSGPAGFVSLFLGWLLLHAIRVLPTRITSMIAVALIIAAILIVPIISASPHFAIGVVEAVGPDVGAEVTISIRSPFEKVSRLLRASNGLVRRLDVRDGSWVMSRGQDAHTGGSPFAVRDLEVVSLPFSLVGLFGRDTAMPTLPDLGWIVLGCAMLLFPGTLARLVVAIGLAGCGLVVGWHTIALLTLENLITLPWLAGPILVGLAAVFGFAIGMSSMSLVGEALRRLAGAAALYFAAPAVTWTLGWPEVMSWILVPLSLLMPILAPSVLAALMFSYGLQAGSQVGTHTILGICLFIGIALNAVRHSMRDMPEGLRAGVITGQVPLSRIIGK